jgi:antagonist of KipI
VALEVLEAGLLTTVQDLGRYGYERYGVPVAGAMDPLALRVANLLVSNPPQAAALEITVAGPKLQTTEDCLVAVTGADLSLRVHGWEMPPWATILVRRGWVIEFGARKAGCRAVLAVAGGIDIAPVMGSRSTCLSGGFGGFQGRPLRQGDLLSVGETSLDLFSLAGRSFPSHLVPSYSDAPELRVITGPQDDYFTPEGVAAFLSNTYQVSITSDRMGCRLEGPAIAHRGPADIISDGIPLGAVQVPADRQPIVMMADRQTTGGYPKIATVISADIPLLAQCLPGQSSVRFAAVTVAEAQACWREMVGALAELDGDSGCCSPRRRCRSGPDGRSRPGRRPPAGSSFRPR